jgi:alpha-tubulin suppressor-like RCC1 family protein
MIPPPRRALLLLAVLAGCGIRLGSRDPGQPEPAEATGQPCETAADCPKPKDPCFAAACADGACRNEVLTAGTIPAAQVVGDCKQMVCDGRGRSITREDPADTPADDGNDCTEERCTGDQAEHAPVAAGAACGQGGVCTGTGICGACIPDKRRCTSGVPERCDASGQWQQAAACGGAAPVCSRGGCARVAELVLGDGVTCARLSDDGARCFGSDHDGILSGEAGGRVTVLESGAEEIALGLHHACARLSDATVACWGDNVFGELGDGGHGPRSGLVRVVGLGAVAQIAAGHAHTCARLADGTVACWGLNHHGQLGDGSAAPDRAIRLVPEIGGDRRASIDLAGPFVQLALGGDRACGRSAGGAVQCWGTGGRTPVGPLPPSAVEAPPPVPAAAPHPAHQGGHGGPGGGHHGAGGGHPPPPHPAGPKSPVVVAAARRVAGLKGVAEIALGAAHSCARLTDGSVMCWGANEAGQLGDGSTAERRAPAKVPALKGAMGLALGRAHTCALLQGGKVACWGDNALGQLGDGSTEARRKPTTVADLGNVSGVAAHGDHTCAWLNDGSVRCWGDGVAGDLGDGGTSPHPAPVTVKW